MEAVTQDLSIRIKEAIRDIPDFPKPGILFKDLTPILLDPILTTDILAAFEASVAHLKIDAICGIESRGFLFGPMLAQRMGIPFILIRKKGKLPGDTVEYSYDLEYGSATIEVHKGFVKTGQSVLVHDDLLATGGTAVAAASLVKAEGGTVAGFSFLVNLSFLNGAEKLKPYSTNNVSLIAY